MANGEDLEGRVMVLERVTSGHDEEIKNLWKETTDLKLCATSLPTISSDLREIKKTVQFLNECKIAQESADKGKKGVWQENRWWIERIIIAVASVVIYVLWASYVHIGAKT